MGFDRSFPSVRLTPVVAPLYDQPTSPFHAVSQPDMSLACDQVAPPSLEVKPPHSAQPAPSRRTSMVVRMAGAPATPPRVRIAPVCVESCVHTPPAWRPRHVYPDHEEASSGLPLPVIEVA